MLFKFRLICTKKQDPDLSIISRDQAKKTLIFSPLKKKVSFSLLFILALGLPLSVANAGIFSFIGGIFEGGKKAVELGYLNSQNIALLQAAVHSDPNPSKGGGDITIIGNSALLPDSGPMGTLADLGEGKPATKSDEVSVYVVREGDSLSQIAKMFGVTTQTLIWANDLGSKGIIYPGQTLVVLPVSGVRHEVEKGETLQSITKKYKGNLEEVMQFNNLDASSTLAVGDVVIIPGGEIVVKASSSSSTSTYTQAVGTSGPSYDGYYIRPINGGRKTQGVHGYNGVDLAAPTGTPVLAAASGEVIVSKFSEGNPWFGGYGNYIVIKHDNGTQTLYAHLSGNIVNRGWRVVQGQVIGYVGSTGRSTGPHVHFEIRGAKNTF